MIFDQCGAYFNFNDYFKKVQIGDKLKGQVWDSLVKII
jgi:hypothetical protein